MAGPCPWWTSWQPFLSTFGPPSTGTRKSSPTCWEFSCCLRFSHLDGLSTNMSRVGEPSFRFFQLHPCFAHFGNLLRDELGAQSSLAHEMPQFALGKEVACVGTFRHIQASQVLCFELQIVVLVATGGLLVCGDHGPRDFEHEPAIARQKPATEITQVFA